MSEFFFSIHKYQWIAGSVSGSGKKVGIRISNTAGESMILSCKTLKPNLWSYRGVQLIEKKLNKLIVYCHVAYQYGSFRPLLNCWTIPSRNRNKAETVHEDIKLAHHERGRNVSSEGEGGYDAQNNTGAMCTVQASPKCSSYTKQHLSYFTWEKILGS